MPELVENRRRASTPGRFPVQASAVVLGGGFALTALGGLLVTGRQTLPSAGLAAFLVLLYAAAYRTEFVSGAGSAVPTQPVLVAMLLLLPLPLVPLAVLCGLQLGGLGARQSGGAGRAFLVGAMNGVHCLGPLTVLALAGHPAAGLGHWPVYLAALATQLLLDTLVAVVRSAGHGLAVRDLAGPLSWTFAVDAMLAPVGLCIVVAGAGNPVAACVLAAPIGLVGLLARDRSTHLEAAVSLNAAFSTVREQARVDAMTGLANRRAWDEALAEATRSVQADPGLCATVLLADLDGLKRVNDSLGHEAGDTLIRAMADILRAALPGAVVAARLGGDEYGVLLVGDPGNRAAGTILDGVRAAMQAHPGVADHPLSASLGLAQSPPARTVEEAALIADENATADKRARRVGR